MQEEKGIKCELTADCVQFYSFAHCRNDYPLIRRLGVRLDGPDAGSQDGRTVHRDIRISVSPSLPALEQKQWRIDSLNDGEPYVVDLAQDRLPIKHEFVERQTETARLDLNFKVHLADQLVAEKAVQLQLAPKNHWGGLSHMPELLAAFVMPNDECVAGLVRKAVATLARFSKTDPSAADCDSFNGYQSKNRNCPYLMAQAIWNTIAEEGISYISPPPSFGDPGQKIRLPAQIAREKAAACLDSSLLFAACLERAGLNPLIALARGHACTGVWLIGKSLPVLTNTDPMEIRKHEVDRDMIFFETTLITKAAPFDQAVQRGRDLIAEEKEGDFEFIIDIAQARRKGIRPLSSLSSRPPAEEDPAPSAPAASLAMTASPEMPKVRADDIEPEDSPKGRIAHWKRKLLDLSKRNKLLNLSSRAARVDLLCPDISKLEAMMAEGRKFRFVDSDKSGHFAGSLFRDNEKHRDFARQQMEADILVANAPTKKKLDNSLLEMYRKSRNEFEESGASTLFLAMGMLKWREHPESDQSYRAPLVLLPVELVRASARARINVMQRPDEDAFFNETLIEFLARDYEIDLSRFREDLPCNESVADIDEICRHVRAQVKGTSGLEVVEELVLSNFSFAKYLMWKNLDENAVDLRKNPFAAHMIDNPGQAYSRSCKFLEPKDLDRKIHPKKVFTPLNCDGSQLVAVEASGKKQDFVIEGPPGTGKSETIANIIAHNIGCGRKVLFVAEKMAALKVVYERLDRVGLGHLCLELHSNKSSKKEVIEQLRQARDYEKPSGSQQFAAAAEKVSAARKKINRYVQQLHKPTELEITPWQAIGQEVRHRDSQKVELGWPDKIQDAPAKSQQDVERLRKLAWEVGQAFIDVRQLQGEDFSLLAGTEEWSHQLQKRIVEALARMEKAANRYRSALDVFAGHFGLPPELVHVLGNAANLSSLAECTESIRSHSYDFALQRNASDRLQQLERFAASLAGMRESAKKAGYRGDPEKLCDLGLPDLQKRYERSIQQNILLQKFVKIQTNRQLSKWGFTKPASEEFFVHATEARQQARRIRDAADGFSKEGIWQGWDTSIDSVQERLDRGSSLARAVRGLASELPDPGSFTSQLQEKLVTNRELTVNNSRFSQQAAELVQACQEFEQAVAGLVELGGRPVDEDKDASLTQLAAQGSGILAEKEKIRDWFDWQRRRQDAEEGGIGAIADALAAGMIEPDAAQEQFDGALYKWLAPILVDRCPELRGFRVRTHEQRIADFCKADEQLASEISWHIAGKLCARKPDMNDERVKKAMGFLDHEIQKKRRHKPVRRLIGEMVPTLLDLTPCLMMSPLSVAKYLPPELDSFDLVVFDEASQITVWDSIGVIARGKNVIVVGDPKQMPPTRFFDRGESDSDEDQEDLESILDQAIAASLKHHRLTGHYRSKHESLIAFSNSHYYENSLRTFPGASSRKSAVSWRFVENGLYAKGKGRNNPNEAQAVVDEVMARLKDPQYNHLTMGIVTLNSEQQRTIDELLEGERRKDPGLERFFDGRDGHAPVFVKNLETVQGDERDVILLSLGYGPTEPGAKRMSMNFGPLNREGGERRLNVAITRATTEVMLFSSFSSTMIDCNRTSARAVEHLKNYMEFAEKGPEALAAMTSAKHGIDEFDSPFEQSVASALREKGWQVQTQVGIGKFRIDQGIIHPRKPGEYLAGIECDGAAYHSSASARDRDRIRQAILERQGWNIIRIWSTDYFAHPADTIENVDEKLNALVKGSDNELPQEE